MTSDDVATTTPAVRDVVGGPEPRDRSLLGLARAGDPNALAEVCRRGWIPVYRSLTRFTDSPAEAEDLTQEVFLRALRSLPAFEDRGLPFNAYLLRIARNMAHDRWRSSHGRAVSTDEVPEQASSQPGPDQLAVAGDQRRRLSAALDRLAPDHSRVLRLRILEGRATHEVAQMMRRSPTAVRQLQVRALEALRTAVGERQTVGEDERTRREEGER